MARALESETPPSAVTRDQELGWSEPEFGEMLNRCRPFTLTGAARMYALWGGVRHVVRNGVPGALVECGVWKGGSAMLMSLSLLELGESTRDLWLYDTFEGMTAPGAEDVDLRGNRVEQEPDRFSSWNQRYTAGMEEVRQNLASTGYPAAQVRLIRGDVLQTLPAEAPKEIALLRLDTDWYESTRHELETLWPRLQPGGVLIIDDYGHWEGARLATDEFLSELRNPPLLVRIDYTARLAVKPSS